MFCFVLDEIQPAMGSTVIWAVAPKQFRLENIFIRGNLGCAKPIAPTTFIRNELGHLLGWLKPASGNRVVV